MVTPLLTTKLYIPPIQPELVSRPRLIERLNAGLRRRLTVICAPAGFGKTTLLSEWISHLGCPISDSGLASGDEPAREEPKSKIQDQESKVEVAWLSLDEGDNDPARFWAYFVAALRSIPGLGEAGVGDSLLAALPSPRFADADALPIETLLAGLINEIVAADPDAFVLILDDYHEIKAQSIHNAFAFLIDHLPPQMYLVVATRVDPPLSTARLRGRGQLAELRQADLRFTLDEVAEFLNQVMGLDLAAGDVAALASRTEGWIAGLQMAVVSMQGREDVAGFIQAFTGSDRYILDYLVEEVLRCQPESIQTFLLQTSILNRLSGPLCDAVLRISESANQRTVDTLTRPLADSQATLEYLERNNLFVVPLDSERRWYRYHRLFADLLRVRLSQVQPDRVSDLHRRASLWYEQNGLQALAIEHTLSAGDFERAGDLIEQVAEGTLMRSEVATFLGWVEKLPDELVRARPTLCLFHAWALLLAGRPLDAVESRLQNVSGDADFILGRVAPLRAFVAAFRGQMARAAELSRRALERLPEDDSFLRGVAAMNLGLSCLASGDVAAGSQALDEAIRMSQEAGNVMIAVMTLGNLAELHVAQGQLCKARDVYQRALELATDRQRQPLPIGGLALIGLGELSREWNDLEAAARYLTEGIERIRQWGEIGALDGYVSLARVKQAQGNVDGARDAIQKAQQLAIKFDATDLDDFMVTMYQVRLWVAQGDIEAAVRWVEGHGLALDEAKGLGSDVRLAESEEGDSLLDYHLRQREHITLARVLIAQKRHDEALALLEPLPRMIERRRSVHSNRRVIELHILRALAFQARGDLDQALAALEQALSLAEPGGYVRIFVDEGPPMAPLLYEAVVRGIAPHYVGKLLVAFEEEMKGEGRKTKPPLLSSVLRPSSSGRPSLPALSPSTALGIDSAERLVEPLSERELEVLQLVAEGLSNREIAQRLFISLRTVKWHTSNIYGKLDVKNRTHAVAKARALGILPAT